MRGAGRGASLLVIAFAMAAAVMPTRDEYGTDVAAAAGVLVVVRGAGRETTILAVAAKGGHGRAY